MSKIDPEFFDLEIYAIYKAIHELVSQDAWKIVWRAGEIVLEKLEDKLNLKTENNVFTYLQKIAHYLQKVGYVKKIEVRKVNGNLIEYEMLDPVIAKEATQLIKEGAVPAHISTSLMVAALKKFNLKMEMIGEPTFLSDKRVIEKWRLSSIEPAELK